MAGRTGKSFRRAGGVAQRARRGVGIAGVSIFATTGMLGAYVSYPGLRRAHAATTCTVSSNGDNILPPFTAGELRYCLNGVNNNNGAINIDGGIGTISLNADLPTITLNGSLTIVGAGMADTVIDGRDLHSAFDFQGGDLSFSSLTIQAMNDSSTSAIRSRLVGHSVTLRDVYIASNESDRAAVAARGDVYVVSSIFANNDNGSSSGDGGAIYTDRAVTVNDSTFTSNDAGEDGGAIYAFGSVTVTDSNFTSNQASRDGGAIYSRSNVSISGSNFTSNEASSSGGAIRGAANVSITASTFTSNQGARGGAVESFSDLSVDESTFELNYADTTDGGGALSSFNGSLTVANSTFVSNDSSGPGGAIRIYDSGGTTSSSISGSTFSANRANLAGLSYGGGAIYTKGATDVVNSTFVGNSGYDGAAMKGNTGDVSINFSTITSNTSAGGAGVYVNSVSAVTIANSILYGNLDSSSATANDAISAGTLTVSNSLLTSNSSFSAAGTLTRSDLVYGDPLLGALASNGGPTQTLLPAADSPVIGMADPSGAPQFDQRGFTRTTNGVADMGSVERGGTAPVPDLSQMPPAWFQAQQRQEQSAVCPPGMHASWAEWPNEQTGGWTCEWSTWWDVNKGTAGGWETTPGFNPGLRVSD